MRLSSIISTALVCVLCLAMHPRVVWQDTYQHLQSTGEMILADETLFEPDFVRSFDKEFLKSNGEKLGYVLPEASRPALSELEAKHGEPDDVVDEKAPRVASDFNVEAYKHHPGPLPVKWVETRVCYYGNIGFGVGENDDTVLFITNRSALQPDSVSEHREASHLSNVHAAAQNNFDGNWNEGVTSSNLFFTVVDNAITNATITNLRFSLGISSCNDGGTITSSYAPPVPISANGTSFNVSGFTGKNVWSIDLDGTFGSDTSISGSESVIFIGNCGFVFGFSSFVASKQPDYVLFTRPSIQQILSGESTSFMVGVNALGSFNQPVDLQMLVPSEPGVTLNLSGTRIRPGETAILNVTTAANAPSVLLGIIFRSSTGQATHDTISILDLSTFTLTANPDLQTIGKGQMASYSLTTKTAQFKDKVNLTSSVSLSTGSVNINFASTSLTPGENTTFTATSSATTPVNTYTITITATSGQIVETTTARLRVSDPDFEFAITPSSKQVGPGSATNFQVDVKSLVGFNQPVNLSTTVSPGNGSLSASISPNAVNPGGSATLTATAAQSAQVNSSFTITVKGTSGPLTHTASATVKVTGPDFALGFNSATVDGFRGAKAKVVVTINRTGGFTGDVTVTPPDASGEGIVAKFPDPITTSDSTASWKFKIKATAATGPHQLTFTGKDTSGRVRTGTVTLVVQ
jgi:hypothetical protein